MKFNDLLSEGKIEKVEKKEFSSESTEKSIEFAKKGLETENYDEVMSVVYNGIFRIASRLMNFLGYRAIGKEHHKNTFEFLEQCDFDADLVAYFDNIRKKRNDFIYRDIEAISGEEAEEILEKAGEFVHKIKKFCKNFRKLET